MTGSQETVLVVVRGPSGAGKSSVAARLRTAYGRGLAVVAQDLLRRTVLRERDVPGGANIGLIDVVARHALDHGFHVVVEGVLAAERYREMLARLAADHRGRSHLYYLDVDFAETVRRHATRPQAAEFSPAAMADWRTPEERGALRSEPGPLGQHLGLRRLRGTAAGGPSSITGSAQREPRPRPG
ncbi:putative kinase [Streptomyces sp. 1114.5]|uniref:AAA family ATPase n=1 Tax=Streptomyces sp. 1114.5 TaxID=1938830 RepID=UPI000EB011FE|nr:AAA family ATPase [Streptomyces sp. 1114.5]RKT09637.1 putative kinase [Streptomyces sp. 1114.5]